MSDLRRQQRLVLASIAGAVLIWGGIHALGAYRFNHHVWRPVIVMACVGVFLGGWLWLMSRRAARQSQRHHDEEMPGGGHPDNRPG